jgi:hypothetical protein
MSIVRRHQSSTERGGDKEETQKEGASDIPTPFGAHVGKPDIRQNTDTSQTTA